MLFDSFFSPLVGRFKRSGRRTSGKLAASDRTRAGPQELTNDQHVAGFFNNSMHFNIDNSMLIGHQNQIVSNFASGTTVLEHLAPYTNLDAVMDSSARFPPPLCHPGTRVQIRKRLEHWVSDPGRHWKIIWLNGPAGIGKSAIAQTFAEYCSEQGCLGATFFFSLLNDRTDPDCVVPTLAYQLAIAYPQYKSLLTHQLAHEPELLQKARRTQFKKLIVEPFSQLQVQGHQNARGPFLIILDGLDECDGEHAQCEIVEMISETVRLKEDLPFLWLICSRPEPHLKHIFSRADYRINCAREELALDVESRDDVDLYLRDGFTKIRDKFSLTTTSSWPSEENFARISHTASGFMAFASSALKYVGDSAYNDPMARLDALLIFLKGIDGFGVKNPLAALDFLYTRVLTEVPNGVLPVTRKILSYIIHTSSGWNDSPPLSAQSLCNFLHIEKHMFYAALQRLHSVVNVPPPEEASQAAPCFYHASFKHYLCDATRSGKHNIDQQNAALDHAKSCLFWYKADLSLFHTTDGLEFNKLHDHEILPDLTWVSVNDEEKISREIARLAETTCWFACSAVDEWDEGLLSQIQNFDFRYIRTDKLGDSWWNFVNRLWKTDPSSGIVRTEPCSEVDLQLVEYTKSMTNSEAPIKPATFPLQFRYDSQIGEYFLIGYGLKAVICLFSACRTKFRVDILNYDEAPSEERIGAYHDWLDDVKWPRNGNQEGPESVA